MALEPPYESADRLPLYLELTVPIVGHCLVGSGLNALKLTQSFCVHFDHGPLFAVRYDVLLDTARSRTGAGDNYGAEANNYEGDRHRGTFRE